MRPLRKSGLVAALALVHGCARCGGAEGLPPERYVPADVTAAVVVPVLRVAVRSTAELYLTARDFPGTSELPTLRASLSAQLGFDPLDLSAMREAGIDSRGGMAVAFPRPSAGGGRGRPAPIVVLPVTNHAATEALVKRIAVDRLAAPERAVETIGAVRVAVYRQRAGAPPALAAANGEDCLVLSTGPAAPENVARALSLDEAASLVASPAWSAARRATAARDPSLIAFVPPGSPALEGLRGIADGVALALSAEPRRLSARIAVLLRDREEGFRALAADGHGGALAARLDPASALVGRFDGDPARLGAMLVPLLPADERARAAAAGLDLRRDLFDLLAPGAAGAVSLAPRLDLSTLDARSLRRDPLRLAQAELVLPVRDPARAAALSDRLVRLAGQRPRGGAWAIPMASGELAWTLEGGRLLLAGGAPGRLSALRGRIGQAAGGYRAPTDVARKALEGGGLGAVILDTRNFAASVRALPPEAFGTGPTGFVMRSLVERFVDPAERIEAATLSVGLEPGALVLDLDLEPRAPEERSP